jgi:hypothetical protein
LEYNLKIKFAEQYIATRATKQYESRKKKKKEKNYKIKNINN